MSYQIVMNYDTYQIYCESCKIEKLTVQCLLKQLNLDPQLFFVGLNGRIIRDLTSEISLNDRIDIIPLVAGGNC